MEFYRSRNEPTARWHFRYTNSKRIAKADVLHIFASTNKSKYGGPTERDVRAARKALPVTPAIAAE